MAGAAGALAAGALAAVLAAPDDPARPDRAAPAPAPAGFTRGPHLTRVGTTTARLRWRVEPPGEVRVVATGPDGERRVARAGVLTGLRPDTRYRWTATARRGAVAHGSLHTAPGRLTGTVRIVAFGDYGAATDGERAVGRLAARLRPRLALTLGDNSYLAALPSLLDPNIFTPLRPLLRIAPLTGILGDHDTIVRSGQVALARALDLPGGGDRFDLRFGPVQVVGLGVLSDPGDVVFATRALARPGPEARLVLIHRPLKPGDPLLGVARRGGAAAVLSGHLHAYERRTPGGVLAITAGTGGAPWNPGQTPRSPDARVHLRTFGLLVADVRPGGIAFRFLDTAGRTLDRASVALPVRPAGA